MHEYIRFVIDNSVVTANAKELDVGGSSHNGISMSSPSRSFRNFALKTAWKRTNSVACICKSVESVWETVKIMACLLLGTRL